MDRTDKAAAMVNEPTPDEAVAALRTIHRSRERVIASGAGSRWLSITMGLAVFLGCAASDLLPPAQAWVGWTILGLVVVLAIGLTTRSGGTLLGRPVLVSDRSLSVAARLLRIAPILGIGIAVAVVTETLDVPHAKIYYGALTGLYIVFLDPAFKLWLLRRQERD
ncbi:hypothetical protein AB0K15_14045 [Amycolatopsis sp. NPDC049253]|uniref:hypothetical protein n=1 Tax=Amycolatopsis sp. NPDC049253 TaxID=3155274 RepID=UPI003421778F